MYACDIAIGNAGDSRVLANAFGDEITYLDLNFSAGELENIMLIEETCSNVISVQQQVMHIVRQYKHLPGYTKQEQYMHAHPPRKFKDEVDCSYNETAFWCYNKYEVVRKNSVNGSDASGNVRKCHSVQKIRDLFVVRR